MEETVSSRHSRTLDLVTVPLPWCMMAQFTMLTLETGDQKSIQIQNTNEGGDRLPKNNLQERIKADPQKEGICALGIMRTMLDPSRRKSAMSHPATVSSCTEGEMRKGSWCEVEPYCSHSIDSRYAKSQSHQSQHLLTAEIWNLRIIFKVHPPARGPFQWRMEESGNWGWRAVPVEETNKMRSILFTWDEVLVSLASRKPEKNHYPYLLQTPHFVHRFFLHPKTLRKTLQSLENEASLCCGPSLTSLEVTG